MGGNGFVGVFFLASGRMRLGWRVLLFLVLFSLALALLSLLPLRSLPWQTLPTLLGAVLAGWGLLALDGREPGALGFYFGPGAARDTLLGTGLGVGVALLVMAGIAGWGGLRWSWEGGSAGSWVGMGAASLWLFALPAAGEEALMRGYLFQALGEAWGARQALWTTSILFSLLHIWNPEVSWLGLGNIAMAGLFLGVVYLRTASLWWATGAHLGWNWAIGFLGDLPVSGLDLLDAPLVEPAVRGPAWASGGAFGPEASVVATLALGLAALLLWRGSWLAPGAEIRSKRPLILADEEDGVSSVRMGAFSTIVDSGSTT